MNRLSLEDRAIIRRRILNGERESAIAKDYLVSRQAINLIKNNSTSPGVGPDASHLTRERRRIERIDTLRRIIESGGTMYDACLELNMDYQILYAFKHRYLPELKFQSRSRQRSHKIGSRKLNFQLAEAMREDRRSGLIAATLAQKYDVSLPSVYGVLSGRTWTSEWTRE